MSQSAEKRNIAAASAKTMTVNSHRILPLPRHATARYDYYFGGIFYMKATGIVRRIDDLGRVVIPKELRRTLRIRDGDPSQTTVPPWQLYCFGMLKLAKRAGWGRT